MCEVVVFWKTTSHDASVAFQGNHIVLSGYRAMDCQKPMYISQRGAKVHLRIEIKFDSTNWLFESWP